MSFVPLSALLFGSAPAPRPPALLDLHTSGPRRSGGAVPAGGPMLNAACGEAAGHVDGEQRAIDARARRRWRDPLQYRVDHARPATRAAAVLQQAARLAAGLEPGPARGVALVEADGAVVLLLAALGFGHGAGGSTDERCLGVQLLAVADVGDRPPAECEELRPVLELMLSRPCASPSGSVGLPAPRVHLEIATSAAPPADPRTALAWALAPAYASAQAARRRVRPHRHLIDVQEKH